MYKIKYYNNEFQGYKTKEVELPENELIEIKTKIVQEPIFQLTKLEYECKNEEFEYWLDVIKKSYGQYGEVTHEYVEDEPTKEELTIKTINNLTIENRKKDILIASLAEQINNLNIKLAQLGGSDNV
ncbi:hypothetical protein [Clostridium sp. UBA6640]|uniref:hypothetical protein n=1 Tax=Clostridium sp. UBA6640 TaxID=1946370 RepID=UPI0025C4C7BD|nr:hypothetical protein [Clostridium sp. UBA6640]